MAEIVFTGGYASSEYQVNWVADRMSCYYDEEVEGVTFNKGIKDPEFLASRIHGKFSKNHSGGILAVQNALRRVPEAQPKDIEAIAPPVPTPVLTLAGGPLRIGANVFMDSLKHPESALGTIIHSAHVLGEVALHSAQHVRAIPKLARFDAVDEAAWNNSRGIPTSLVMMNNDEFFVIDYDDILKAKREGVSLTHIRGEHCDFISRPEYVLSRIATARAAGDQDMQHDGVVFETKLPA